MTHLVEVAFRGNRKEFFQWEAEAAPALHTGVIVTMSCTTRPSGWNSDGRR